MGFKSDNYIPGCEGKSMKIIKSESGIKFNLFYISGKQDYSKIIFRKLLNDTAFISLYCYSEGEDNSPFFQEIQVFISDESKKINYKFFGTGELKVPMTDRD